MERPWKERGIERERREREREKERDPVSLVLHGEQS
jgi:hypothetical protein